MASPSQTLKPSNLGLPLYVTMILIVFLARISSDCLTEKRELSTERRKVVGEGKTFLNCTGMLCPALMVKGP